MDLQSDIHYRLDTIFKEFISTIADHFNIDYQDLATFCERKSFTCMYILRGGPNRGKCCPTKALENGYCGKHQMSASVTVSSLVKKTKVTKVKPKALTKGQKDNIEWLNTAVPKEVTELVRTPDGLLHEESDILFDESYMVIGKMNNGSIVKLSHFEIERCERMGWQYDPNNVEDDSE